MIDNSNTLKEPLFPKETIKQIERTQKKSFQSKYQQANWFSTFIFHWTRKVVKQSKKEDKFKYDYLGPLRREETGQACHQRWESRWKQYQDSDYTILNIIWNEYKWNFGLSIIFLFVATCASYSTPLFITWSLTYANSPNNDYYIVAQISGCLLLSKLVFAYFQQLANFRFNLMGMKVRQSLEVAIYLKILKVSIIKSVDYDKGKLINLLMVDCKKLYDLCTWAAEGVLLPFQLGFALYCILTQVG